MVKKIVICVGVVVITYMHKCVRSPFNLQIYFKYQILTISDHLF